MTTKANYYFRVSAVLVAMVVAVLVMSHNHPASAQSTTAVPGTTITVNTKVDELTTDGDCSLREAIQAANTNTAVDKCKAGSSTERDEIHFSLGKRATIELGSTLPTITDGGGLTIAGGSTAITISGDDSVGDSVGVFVVNSGATLALNKLTVANGSDPDSGYGGGIRNGDITSDPPKGGGTLEVTNSTFSNNSANVGGGGISNVLGTLTVTNSTFSGNSAGFDGGGILNYKGALTVTNSTFSGNSASNFGGGINNNDQGTLTVTNSTFSGNSASGSGGDNGGGGIFNLTGGATVNLLNTIVANSTLGGNCSGAITDGGYNIDDGTTCGFSQANNSLPNTDPKLADNLAKNGGPTKTIALLKGSPALNAIPKATKGCGTTVTTDQRGVTRPQGKACDIGAFEKKKRRR